MRIEIGSWLKYADDSMNDGTLFEVKNIIVENGALNRIHCNSVCAGMYLSDKKIMAQDIHKYTVVTVKSILYEELIDWCNRLHLIICNDHCKSDKTKCSKCWMQQPIELIKEAKEMIT